LVLVKRWPNKKIAASGVCDRKKGKAGADTQEKEEGALRKESTTRLEPFFARQSLSKEGKEEIQRKGR
jgi:hypothetical protein